ncbi:RNA 2',3'-cyclic phosphodiesterase [Nocardioides nanhaiensis]|uniref:RNA 2',3'-cyclic phosphodiesterase n=1 Tax=Nocardioides nanhaiensis TaxID=1476871 RepID=A0ABP8WE84_9ACTN
MHRLFVALRPPEEAAQHLDDFLEVRRAAAPFRWTPADQLHLTLAFCPQVPDHLLDDLLERLAVAASRRRPPDLAVAGGGAFPDPDRGRVLWAGLRTDPGGEAELAALATGARNAAVAAGVVVDGQRFRPHLTVARCGRPTQLTSWVRLLDAYDGPAWRAEHLELVASHLGEGPRRRPRHEVLAELPLGG